jgi:glyoxylase-like metal-dependent hydrolase (beta-lactamase superfamily II)
MLRWVLRIVIGLIIIAAGAVYWLFYDNRMPTEGRFPLDIATIRAEAERLPGPKPTIIEVEFVSRERQPRIAMVAGTSWAKANLTRASFRIVAPGETTIIDTAYDETTAGKFESGDYDKAAWSRLVAALDGATRIVVTHEHSDHIGGLINHPNLATVLPKALLNPEQFAVSPNIRPLVWPAGSRQGYTPFNYQGIRAIAPGIVLIRAPGHTPGAQMVYVQRADGQEYLFMGDVASMADNVRLQRIRSRLVTDWFTHEDRRAVMLQTQALGRLQQDVPNIALIPGHDADALSAFVKGGILRQGFSPAR